MYISNAMDMLQLVYLNLVLFYIERASNIRKLSKCLRTATNAPWYIGNTEIHDDFGFPFFTDIRSLRDSTQS